jgi:hypothetical protein
MLCQYCQSTNIMVIDVNTPPNLFECIQCNRRFHSCNFEPQQIDSNISLDVSGQLDLNLLLGRK